MYNLLRYFIKYGAFILFILFEVLCFYLIINYNQNQRVIFDYSSNQITSSIAEKYRAFNQYVGLTGVVDSLAEENAKLLSLLRTTYSKSLNDSTIRIEIDSSRSYFFEPCHIITNSVNRRNNTLIINKGKKDKVINGAGVISNGSPIGVIHNSSENYSSVWSILHSQVRISAAIKKSGYFGSLVWKSSNPQILSLEAIPKHVPVAEGDTIVTSGYSLIFPPDLPIGVIVSQSIPQGSAFRKIDIKLIHDISAVKTAYVVYPKYIEELKQINE